MMELKNTQAQPFLSIKTKTTREGIADAIRASYTRLAAYLERLGKHADAPPFASFQVLGDSVDLEAGFILAQPVQGEGDIAAGEFPGGRVASTIHTGPYDASGPVYEALFKWIAEQGLSPAGPPREVYITDPETVPDPKDYQTEIVVPVN